MPTLNSYSRVRRARRSRAPGWVLLAAIPLLTVLTAPAPVASGAPTDGPVTVTVAPNRRWTATDLTVKAGESITIDATGTVRFGPFPIDMITPSGQPPAECADLVALGIPPFTAPALDCWSLIARIGTDDPLPVGTHTQFRATSDGPLELGVNDNRLLDNTGSWEATISITAASGGGGGSGAPGGESSSGSNVLLFVLIGLAILGLLLALFFLARRRRGKGDAEPGAATDAPPDVILAEPAPSRDDILASAPLEQPAEEPVASFAKAPAPLGTSVAPVEGEVADTNIFEVEIANGTDLRVGYNYFPEDTDLHWQVRQGSVFAHGQFPTNGGGNMYHYVTLPLGVHLEPAPAAVDVTFTWSIGGVPFRYAVRRDPGL